MSKYRIVKNKYDLYFIEIYNTIEPSWYQRVVKKEGSYNKWQRMFVTPYEGELGTFAFKTVSEAKEYLDSRIEVRERQDRQYNKDYTVVMEINTNNK